MKILRLVKINSFLFMFYLYFIPIFFLGCSATKTIVIPEPKNLEILKDFSFIEKQLNNRKEYFKSLKGIAHIDIKTPEKSISSNTIIALKSPDLLRFEILGPFNQLIALIISDGKNLYQIDLKNSAVNIIPNLKSASEKFFGMPLLPCELIEMITGNISLAPTNQLTAQIDNNNVLYVLTERSSSDNLIKKYLISVNKLVPLMAIISDRNENIISRVIYSYSQDNDNYPFPQEIICDYYPKGVQMKINFREINLNAETSSDLFIFKNLHGFETTYSE